MGYGLTVCDIAWVLFMPILRCLSGVLLVTRGGGTPRRELDRCIEGNYGGGIGVGRWCIARCLLGVYSASCGLTPRLRRVRRRRCSTGRIVVVVDGAGPRRCLCIARVGSLRRICVPVLLVLTMGGQGLGGRERKERRCDGASWTFKSPCNL